MQAIDQFFQAIFYALFYVVALATRGEIALRTTMAQEGISQSAQGVILISADLLLFCVFTYLCRGWLRAVTVFVTVLILIHLLQLWALTPGSRDSWYGPLRYLLARQEFAVYRFTAAT